MNRSSSVTRSDIGGIWSRDYIKTPDSFDQTTLVWWFQSDVYHVDMRIPQGFGTGSAWADITSYSQLDDEQLRSLTAAEGFAGTTEVENSVCTWARHINYRGRLQGLDIGLLEQIPEGLLESGIQDDYTELWQPHYISSQPSLDLQLPGGLMMQSVDAEQYLFIVYTSTRFALGRGRPADLDCSKTLAERLASAIRQKDQATLATLLDMEFCIGTIGDCGGVIDVSTNPLRKDAIAFAAGTKLSSIQALELNCLDFYGNESQLMFQASESL